MTVSYSPIQEKKNECSISSEGAKGAEIFDFSFWRGALKKFTFKATIILEIVMFMFDFLNLPASRIVLIYFHLPGTCIKYKMSLKNMVYKKCSSYSFLRLKVSHTNEFYKHYKGFWKLNEFGECKNYWFLRMLFFILNLFFT